MKAKRKGVELRLLFADKDTCRCPILLSLNRWQSARRWFDKITSGGAASSAEIARREGLQKGYVAHLTRLEFFSPTVVEMLLSTPAAG